MDVPNPHTCTTCSVMFKDAQMQREHYKTDWHRYNLKRKVAEMPPVTLDVFQDKMDKHQEKVKALSGEIAAPTGYCVCCRKSFNTEKAYDNHILSKKHKQTAAKFDEKKDKMEIQNNRLNRKPSESAEAMEEVADEGDDGEVEEVDSDEWEDDEDDLADKGDAIPNTDCIFCSHHSR